MAGVRAGGLYVIGPATPPALTDKDRCGREGYM